MHYFILSLFASLIFILNIPHTIAVRNGLVYILLIVLIYEGYKNKEQIKLLWENSEFKKIIIILIALTAYILLHSIFISHELSCSLDEFRGQWITPVGYFIVGGLLAIYTLSGKLSKETVLTVLFYSMFVHILYIDLVALDKWLQTKSLISRYGGLTGSPVLVNYLTNILLAMLISEIIYRLRVKKRVLLISNILLYFYFILLIFSTFVEGMRHGVMALVFLGVTGSIVFLYKNKEYSKKMKYLIGLSLIFLMIIPLAYNLKYDSRWNSLIETIDISLDTQNNLYWLNRKYEIPKLESGQNVSASNYERMAWGYKGTQFIIEDPIGIGFGRNAFGHACEMRYPDQVGSRGKHSHSSLIDFTIGVGVIGLLIWIIFIARVIKTTVLSYKSHVNYYAMFLFFITTGFFTRSILDSNMRDHMFLQFMLMAGVGLVMLIQNDKKLSTGNES